MSSNQGAGFSPFCLDSAAVGGAAPWMRAQTLDKRCGRVAVHSLMAMVGGTLAALALGAVAGALFVFMFTLVQNKWNIDDVLGVWPLHGLCGSWGGLAAGVFGSRALGGRGGVHLGVHLGAHLGAQLIGTLIGVAWTTLCGFTVYGVLKRMLGLRLSREEEHHGADLSIHRIGATPEREANRSWGRAPRAAAASGGALAASVGAPLNAI